MTTTGQRIAAKRKELGLSQEALGEKLGVSRQSIYKWESDTSLPEIEKLISLSRLFSVSIGWLLGGEENSENQQWVKELENASAKVHIRQLEALHEAERHKVADMEAVGGAVKANVEGGFAVVYQFPYLVFVCHLGNQAAGFEFFINLHKNLLLLFSGQKR